MAGTTAVLVGLASLTVGFVGIASSAAADESDDFPPCDVPTMTVVVEEAWTEEIFHPAVEEITEQVMTDPGQPYIAPTEDRWENVGWYNWTGGPRAVAPALDDPGWHGPLPNPPQGAPHDAEPGNVYSTSTGQGNGSWFKYDGDFVQGSPGQEYIAPTYDTVVVTEGQDARTEYVDHPAVTDEVANPAFPCEEPQEPQEPEEPQQPQQPEEPEEPQEQPEEEQPWVAGTETQTRTVDGAADCDTKTVATWTEVQTRTEIAEGVWGAWSDWTKLEGSDDVRTMTGPEVAECAVVKPTEQIDPGPVTEDEGDDQGQESAEESETEPVVLGVEVHAPATAPAAVPTAVDAGLAAPTATLTGQTNVWVWFGGALMLAGLALAAAPRTARARYGR